MKKNQFGDVVEEEKTLNVDDWKQKWEKGQTRFHVDAVHPTLQKYYHIFFGQQTEISAAPEKKRFFIPLCGKSKDMMWLASEGHEVVGVECSHLACTQFFSEQGIPFSHEAHMTLTKAEIFKSLDPKLKIRIYCCDFFLLNRADLGAFDCIWDRGSFAALDDATRKKYVPRVSSLMDPHSHYLLCTFYFDNSNFAGPPFPTMLTTIRTLYTNCTVNTLGERDCLSPWQKEWGLDWFTEQVHLVMLKAPQALQKR